MEDSKLLKAKMQKVLSLIGFYEDLKSRKISNRKSLDDARSKMLFTQQQILKLCLQSKKIMDDMEIKDHID